MLKLDFPRILLVTIVACSGFAATSAHVMGQSYEYPPRPTSPQRKSDLASLAKWIASQAGCEGEGVSINDLEYFDFKGDGGKELIVVASTCNTGTAGPDVHSVLSRDGHGGFFEEEIPEIDAKYSPDLGENANYSFRVDLSVQEGLLVATWWDNKDRQESPLIVRYKWRNNGFIIDSVIAPSSDP